MSVVNNLGDVVLLGSNPLSSQDPEIKTLNGEKIKINGVELDPTGGGGGGGGSVAKANEFKLENPMSDADTRAVLFQQTENATDLKISTKSGTGSGIITFEANGQTANKFQVNDSGALCTGNLATLGKIQLADPSATFNANEVSQFTQNGENLTVSTQQVGDINLVTSAEGGHINFNPNGTNVMKLEPFVVNINQETVLNKTLKIGTASNEATIFQPQDKQLTINTAADANISSCALNVESAGLLNLTANGTASFVKLAVGNTTKLLAFGGEVMIGPEGTNVNRLIGGTKITEANTPEAKNEEAELKMTEGGLRHDLEINTAGTGTSKGQLVVNTDIEPSSTFTNIVTEANPINPSAPIVFYSEHISLFHDALKFNQSWKRTVTIDQAAQNVNAETGILFVGGVNTTTTPPTVENFTQYYNGYKTKTAGGGDVLAPLLALQGTGGFLTFEFFNSGQTSEPTAPFPLPSSFTTNDQLAFPATNGRGVGAPAAATNGYLGLKIDVPFVIPKLHTLAAPVQGNIAYLDSNVSLIWNNLVGNFPHHVQVIYKPLPSANGQFNFTLKMPNLTATPFSAVNFALCYITYQPTHDLRELN